MRTIYYRGDVPRFLILAKAADKIAKARARDRNHQLSMTISLLIYGVPAVVMWLVFREHYPVDLSELYWSFGGTSKMLLAILPIMAWPVLFHLFVASLVRHDVSDKIAACDVLKIGTKTSIRAGFFEELVYRWLLPILVIPPLLGLNSLLGGGDDGIVARVSRDFGEIANFFTFGILEEELLTAPWVLGAAIIFANGVFRDGHKYQGLFGLLNSWFVGMYFFFLTFNFGLITAMIIHVLYDVVIGVIVYADTHWDTRHIRLVRHNRR